MSLVPRATLTVACAAAVAALATTSTAAETSPSGGVSLSSDPAPAPAGSTIATGAVSLDGGAIGSKLATAAPALPAPIRRQFSGPTGPSGGVALFPLAHIAPRLPSSRGARRTARWG